MRLFALDLHISIIADLRDILKDHEIVEWSLSGHNWVFGRPTAQSEIIRPDTWKDLTLEQMEAFRRKYDSFLRGFDAFLVGYVPAYAMLFAPYGKPILGSLCCRYDVPFCFTKQRGMREIWNEELCRMLDSGQLQLFANNRGDADYLALGTGKTIPLLPSLCRYTQMKHAPVHSTFFGYSPGLPNHPLITHRSGRFEWSDLAMYRGVVHLPYELSTMSLCEQYQAGIPIFVPSKSFLRQLWSQNRIEWWSVHSYWGSRMPPEMSPCLAVDFWVERADYYDPENMPYVYTFDSLDDLLRKLETFQDIHYEARMEWIRKREDRAVQTWEGALERACKMS